jgi:iron(III) transport system ATP-binding protein
MSLLSLEQLTKYYPAQPLPAVDHLSLALAKGEILALLGPSGCGKTTTLRLIAGFERPDAGVVVIGGRVMADGRTFVPPERRGVGVVFQESTLFPHLTVEENVLFGLRHLAAQERTQRLREMLEMVGLCAFARRYPHELSGGQQRRVALARALAPRPAVLLLDEPFSNLDADLRTQMLHEVYAILHNLETTAAVEVMIRPHHLELRPDATGNGLVVSRRFRGADALVVVQLPSGVTLHSYQPSTFGFQARERVKVVTKPTHVVAFLAAES